MEKNQYELCREIFRRFHRVGILDNLILIGSWCVYFYKDYFADIPYMDAITLKTRDIDFLIDKPRKIKTKIDVFELLKDLGFVLDFRGTKGYIKFVHPDLILEFLVPEIGRGMDKPYPLLNLGANATALRFLDFLSANTIKIRFEDFYLNLPHPANFALHKLIIFQRRVKEEKAAKDRQTAVEILKALINQGESAIIKHVFDSTNPKWQRKIIKGLEDMREQEIIEILKPKA